MSGFITYLVLILSLMLSSCGTKHPSWPAWQYFIKNYISPDGRVIDASDTRMITTSEGQSYALFFALVANDREMFDKILIWTENNLAAGDLKAHTPSWLWGKNTKNQWGILDENSAADADIWIAYDLIEAGRLWGNSHYQDLGIKLLALITREEVQYISKLGYMLLPWKKSIAHEDGRWVLNPSYAPPELLSRFALIKSPWRAIYQNNLRFLMATSPKGFAPDWVIWDKEKGWMPNTTNPNIGSYNAIRVYLWAGMLANDSAQKSTLLRQFRPMVTLTTQNGVPPTEVDTSNGKAKDSGGPIGFSAALLPMLASNHSAALAVQRQLVHKETFPSDNYYNAVLILFGQGWDEQRYHFDNNGFLVLNRL